MFIFLEPFNFFTLFTGSHNTWSTVLSTSGCETTRYGPVACDECIAPARRIDASCGWRSSAISLSASLSSCLRCQRSPSANMFSIIVNGGDSTSSDFPTCWACHRRLPRIPIGRCRQHVNSADRINYSFFDRTIIHETGELWHSYVNRDVVGLIFENKDVWKYIVLNG